MSTSVTAFLIIGGVGFLLLVVSLVFGDFGGDHDFDVGHAGLHDTDASEGPSWFGMKPICAGMVGLGTVGFTASFFGVPTILAWLLAVAGGIGVAAIARQWILLPLSRMQGNATISRDSYIGKRALVILSVPPSGSGRYGEVRFCDDNGATVQQAAVSQSDSIPTGTYVNIADVTASAVIVKPASPDERI